MFSDYINHNFNLGVSSSTFPNILKNAELKPVLKRILEQKKKIIDQSEYGHLHQRPMND